MLSLPSGGRGAGTFKNGTAQDQDIESDGESKEDYGRGTSLFS